MFKNLAEELTNLNHGLEMVSAKNLTKITGGVLSKSTFHLQRFEEQKAPQEHFVGRRIFYSIREVVEWLETNAIKIEKHKTSCDIFHQKR